MESQHLKIYKNRLFVASLIEDVLSEKISVLDALSKFPKDKNDINIKCAFDALVHREADEDLRRKIRDYAITQDEFLEDLAYILKENQMLVVPPETGILSNDIIKHADYKIVILENSENSNLKHLEVNETTGSFSYTPSKEVKGNVSFKYYIEYEDKKTNVSYINFYVKNDSKNNKEKVPNTGV